VREVTIEGLPRRLAVRVDVQHDPRDLAPIGPFRIRVEQAHVGDGVPFVVGGERRIGGR